MLQPTKIHPTVAFSGKTHHIPKPKSFLLVSFSSPSAMLPRPVVRISSSPARGEPFRH